MYIIMDMGTSNTRLWLCSEDEILACKRREFGAGVSKKQGRAFLYDSLKGLIEELLLESSVAESDVECILVSGMAGSEIGLLDVPHIPLPADIYRLADSLTVTSLREISDAPFVFVHGLKKVNGDMLVDIMRGEETETAGILTALKISEDAVLVLPGTHNKIISVSASGEITDFCTTFSGELLNGIITDSILTGQVSHSFNTVEAEVLKGAAYAEEKGLNAALFHIRVMAKNGKNTDILSSFLYGAVMGEDIKLIRRIAGDKRIYIGGREALRRVYGILLGEDSSVMLDGDIADNAVRLGLARIYKLYRARARREDTLRAIEEEKLVAIVRAPERETLIDAMRALYNGGVRLAEITFDRSGKIPKQYTAEMIKLLVDEFGNDMLVGAGTVTTKEDVMMAYEAGAAFIISPNCDTDIIELTRSLGLVSIPAAFTPTEIARAVDRGADYIKLFPADQLGEGYIKAVTAPLSDAKLLAVGGVRVDNARKMIENGFYGIGVGSNLYNKKLIKDGDFDALTELARKYSEAVKN